MSYELKEIVRVADMYYKKNLKQESIGRRLGVSKYTVSRMLKKALESGVVQINVIDEKPIKSE